MSGGQGWAVVATFAQVYEAEISKAILESAGIPAQVLGEHIGVFGPGWSGMAIRGVRLVVPGSLLQDAQEVLSEDAYFEHDPDESLLDDESEESEDEPGGPGEEWRSWGEWGPGA
jgi:hypothetical protein